MDNTVVRQSKDSFKVALKLVNSGLSLKIDDNL